MFSKYNHIDTKEKLKALDEFLMESDKPKFELIAFDTETNGLQLYKTVVIGFSISTDSKSGFYIPLLRWIPDKGSLKTKSIEKVKWEVYENGKLEDIWNPGTFYEEFVTPKDYKPPEFIKDYLERWLGNINIICHNAPFDVNHTFINFGVDLAPNIFMDTILLSHIINENSPNGLKETSEEWKEDLGINPHVMANMEQQELGTSIIRNGGKASAKIKHVWRGDQKEVSKYACADTFLTYGLFEVGMEKFIKDYGHEMIPWLFEEEVMPLCREAVIPLRRHGMYIDVPFFKRMQENTQNKLNEIEDEIIRIINPLLEGFSIGKSVEEAISDKRFHKKLIELEGLEIPKKVCKDTGNLKETLAKAEIKKAYQDNPHWVWGYLLGEDELKYSDEKIRTIKNQLYIDLTGKKYQFNINSTMHLRWLFCDKLGYSRSKLPQTDSATKEKPIPSMGEEVLSDYFLEENPWVERLLLWKKLNKQQTTYVTPAIDRHINSWLYVDLRQDATTSGRFSCSRYNLQTLPRAEEIEVCKKCKSNNIEIVPEIELLSSVHCKECEHVETEVLTRSAIKRGFIAPPGYKIIAADYSSLEPRVFSVVSGDDKLKDIFRKNLDMYSKIYCDMHGEDFRDLKKSGRPGDKANRDMIKPIGLGIPYGMRAMKVASSLGLMKTFKNKNGESVTIPDREAGQEKIDLYLGAYPDLKDYMFRSLTDCVTKGEVSSLFGRKKHFIYAPYIYNLISSKSLSIDEFLDLRRRSIEGKHDVLLPNGHHLTKQELKDFCNHFKIREIDILGKGGWAKVRGYFTNEINLSRNHPIQSSAASITNRGMINANRAFKKHNIDAICVMQVHDEIITYAKIEQAEKASELLRVSMEDNIFTAQLDVKMTAAPIIGDNLRETK